MGGSRAEVRWDAARGVWYARPYLGVNRVTGRPVRPYRSFPGARGREEAQEMCDRWAAGLVPEIGLHVGRTVPEIAAAYVDHLSASGAAASTVRSYRSVVRAQIAPVLSGVDVDELRPYAVEGFYAALMSPSRAGGGVGASTVLKTHWLLSGMYRWAVRIGAASSNPMPSVGRPRPAPREAAALDEVDMRRVDAALRAAMADPTESHAGVFRRNAAMAAFLSLRLGVRCGEALALTRSRTVGRRGGRSVRVDATAVELPGGPVMQPRTKGGRGRTLSVTEAVGAEMRAHVAWQDSTYLPRASGATPLCCLEGGAVMRPSKVSAWFSRLRDDLGLPPGTSFHTLRHTHATWLLYQGVDVRTVSERLGHAKVTTTLELYAHVLPGRDELAAEAFDEAVGGGHGAR